MASKAALETVENPWRFLQSLRGDSVTDLELVRRTREHELRVVADMVAASRASILYAFSGNGKTSLINAGIVPFFDNEGYPVYRTRPRPPWCPSNPLLAFKHSILRDLPEPAVDQTDLKLVRQARQKLKETEAGHAAELDKILRELESRLTSAKDPTTAERAAAAEGDLKDELLANINEPLCEFVKRVRARFDPKRRIVFVCDQFEELFVHYSDTPQLDEFINALGSIWASDELPIHLLFSMREEWVGSMITFRRAIPDIFASSFKLNPLRVSACKPILQLPAKARGLVFDEDAASRILQDLAENYSLNARLHSSEVRLAPSPARDPFVELPALQVVVDQLWQTREAHTQPFSISHYEWLGEQVGDSQFTDEPGAQHENGATPATGAKKILDNYLLEILDRIEDADPAPASIWKDLRIDCLYLLTDRSRHRRALVEPQLIEELNQIRPTELGLPRVDASLLVAALRPLVKLRLVHVETAADGLSQYELAHDFLVRSVVTAWRHLDRRRTGDLAILTRAREQQEAALQKLATTQRRALHGFLGAPVVAGLALVLATFYVVASADEFFGTFLTPFSWIMISAASLMTVTSIVRQVRLHVGSSVVFLLFTLFLLTVGSGHAGQFLHATLPLFLWFLFVFPFLILDVNRRVVGSSHLQRIVSILWAELVDFVIMAAPFGLGLLVLNMERWGDSAVLFILASASSVGPLALAFRLASTGNTPGLRRAGFTGVQTGAGERPGFLRALFRQFLLLLWGAPLGISIAAFVMEVADRAAYGSSMALDNLLIVCALWLPWLILSPLLIGMTRRHRNLYDILAGTAPVGLGREPIGAAPLKQAGAAASAAFSSEPEAGLSASRTTPA